MQVLKDYISFNADALKLRERRNMVIGSNIANAATPGFKARDIDFEQVLKAKVDNKTLSVSQKFDCV